MQARARSLFAVALLAAIGACLPAASENDGEGDVVESTESELGTQKPSNTERVLGCPMISTDGEGFAPSSLSSPVTFDTTALRNVVGSDVKTTVVLVRHVDGQPVYRYLSNGTQEDIFQPWSSTKFFAAAGAGAKLRKKSNGAVGLTGKTSNGTPLGDLVTIIASYREQNYTSNGLGRYFLNVGGRAEASSLIHDWLDRPARETYGSNYGAPAPELGYAFTDGSASISVTPDTSTGPNNQLSTRTLAEYMKRLVMWEDETTRLPGLQQADIETLMYGAKQSKYWPQEKFGGLSADVALHIQNAIDMNALESKSKGRWRLFGKAGWGCNPDRGCERVNVQYLCAPELDSEGAPIPGKGAELIIATKLVTRTEAESKPAADAAYRKIMPVVLSLANN